MYTKNIVTLSKAIIFVHTNIKGLDWPNAIERGEMATEIFEELFEFTDVKVSTNPTKAEMIH